MNRKLEIVKTMVDNYTLKVDGVFIHSKYNPLKEAKTFVNSNIDQIKGKKYVVIYGFALGYHIDTVLKSMDEESSLIVFDADKDIVNIAKSGALYKRLIKDSRLKCFFNYDDKFLSEFSKALSLVNSIIIYRPSLKVLPEKFKDINRLLHGYELAKIEIEKHGKIAENNYCVNLSGDYKKIKDFLNASSLNKKDIVIVSSGPSLDFNIDALKRVRDKIKIFCVGSSAEFLAKKGIIPDMICIIDPQDIVYNQLKFVLNENVPLCFLASACSRVVSEWNYEKFMFFNDYKLASEHNDILIETGKSVATAALSIAVLSKPHKVILIGQDLGYLNGKSHHDNYGDGKSKGSKTVKSVDGKYIETNEGFLYFKSWIEEKIRKSSGIEFINCSRGAHIEGTKVSSLIDAVN
ncbi:motility associated factor glycosyltransferase family protein [Clostridium felsineum]|uniref:6-hydroxymethylpterin diphosphokinase MptE-like domain-containing protein n=1 Tax=Clostridium felsineum TaxID=36839 RepID=A0A1S8L8X7_9CLOT|nr:6-hydroxymethylpterin diphosphokinase MptE-like protein [Clostridium felsineum]URZ06278.1 hypothetical protein CLROS_016110 [Clostridium felsineum]URZ11313.1 hypothetical protein CROST_020300 [Clostridium felsineum]